MNLITLVYYFGNWWTLSTDLTVTIFASSDDFWHVADTERRKINFLIISCTAEHFLYLNHYFSNVLIFRLYVYTRVECLAVASRHFVPMNIRKIEIEEGSTVLRPKVINSKI